MKKLICVAAALVAGVVPGVASAHAGHGDASLLAGALHLFTGLDHLLVLIAAGFCLAMVPGRRERLGGCLLLGAALAAGIVVSPWLPVINMEPAICATLVVLGGMVALAINVRLAGRLAALAAIALIHGITHGQEMPAGAGGYAVGLVAGSVAVALAASLAAPLMRALPGRWVVRVAGAGIAIVGVVLAGI